MAATAGAGSGLGITWWWASLVAPQPATSAYAGTERKRASAARSRTNAAPPSPSTNPSRARSNGREAAVGSAFLRESARRLPKVASPIGVTAMSHAPRHAEVDQPETEPAPTDLQRVIAAGAGGREGEPRTRKVEVATDPVERRFGVLFRVVDPVAPGGMVGLPEQHQLGAEPEHQPDPRPEAPSPSAGVAQGRLDAPDRDPLQRRAGRERSGVAPGRAGDRRDLAGDPARVIGRREPGHDPHARPAFEEGLVDRSDRAAERARGPPRP